MFKMDKEVELSQFKIIELNVDLTLINFKPL